MSMPAAAGATGAEAMGNMSMMMGIMNQIALAGQIATLDAAMNTLNTELVGAEANTMKLAGQEIEDASRK
jgi:hypothetical protein